MENLLIYGAGKLGQQVYYHLNSYYLNKVKVLGFVDDTKPKNEKIIDGLLTLGTFKEIVNEKKYLPTRCKIVFAIGYGNMRGRQTAYQCIIDHGYKLFSMVHPKAIMEKNTTLGEGCIILSGAVIDQGVFIGPICYVDIGVTIGEDCHIGANNYFSASCVVGGSVKIGEGNFFGLNSTIVNDVTLGSNLMVNAQTLVHKNFTDNLQVMEYHKVLATLPLKK